jgi:hypothetical protein
MMPVAGRRFDSLPVGRLLDPVDLDIAEMRLAIGILVQIVDTHRSTLLYLPTIPGFGPREFDFPHQSRAEQQNRPTSGIRRNTWRLVVARRCKGADGV